MKLSIITINYNNVNGLKKTIDSIVCQTWRDFEWIIIDGGSTDGSKELIEQVAAEEKNNVTYWCSEPDKGIYNAMNKGIDKAKGEWLNFMNSGDGFYEKETLEKVFGCEQYASERERADVLYGDAVFSTGDNRDYRCKPDELSLSYMLKTSLYHQSSYIRSYLLKESKYDEQYRIVSDWSKWIELLLKNKIFVHICDYLSICETGGISFNYELDVAERKSCISKIIPDCVKVDFSELERYKEREAFFPELMDIYDICRYGRTYRRIVNAIVNFIHFLHRIHSRCVR